MDNLIYRGWIWPQNPENFQMAALREPVYAKDTDGNSYFSGMGPVKRTVTGSGAFFGDTAYADFQELLKIFDFGDCAKLIHPIWGSYRMYFTELELTQEPRADYVAYKFEFREADDDEAIPQ